jgi:membrane-bound transcription factor site-1 protease
VLALLQHGAGRLGLYGDSNCLDSSHSRSRCFKLLAKMLEWASGKVGRSPALQHVCL